MTIDYGLSMGSHLIASVTHSPIITAIPTVLRFSVTVFPRIFPFGISKTYSSEEQKKLEEIGNLINGIRKDLSIDDSVKINLRVLNHLGANAGMLGTTNSLGGPLLCVGNSYFKNYEPIPSTDDKDFLEWIQTLNEMTKNPSEKLSEEKEARIQHLSERFKHLSILNDAEFREWMLILHEIPNTPSELGKFIDHCSLEKRNRIKDLAKKFEAVLSQDELESVLAHELGHAKHHHALKSSGLMLLILTADKLAKVFANTLGFGTEYAFASVFMVALSIDAISRVHEKEADGECAHVSKYQNGLLNLHKKNLINDLFKKTTSSFETKATEMLHNIQWRSSHPNNAKRLQHAIEISKHQNHPKTAMTNVAWVLAGLGLLRLGGMCYSNALKIFA
jgi:hypothetical protein